MTVGAGEGNELVARTAAACQHDRHEFAPRRRIPVMFVVDALRRREPIFPRPGLSARSVVTVFAYNRPIDVDGTAGSGAPGGDV